MHTLRQLLRNVNFALVVLLAFLFLFRDHMELPEWLQVGGRMHPMVLHFPIVLLVFAWPLYIWQHRNGDDRIHDWLEILLLFTVLFATLTALSGLFLSTEGGYDPDTLFRHRAAGMATVMFACAIWYVYTRPGRSGLPFHIASGLAMFFLVAGSHLGSELTHGEDFLLAPLARDTKPGKIRVTDSTAVYAGVISPIMASKCYACHDAKHAKGGLVMTEEGRFLKGGKNGAPVKAGKPDESLLIQRLLLPMEDEKHMPPADRHQPDAQELALLHGWVLNGASLTRSFREFPVTDSFRGKAMAWAKAHQVVDRDSVTYAFKDADPKKIEALNGPTRLVQPIAMNSPALSVQFFIRQLYDPKMLDEISAIRDQVVQLDMGSMPVHDDGLKAIAQLPNLEKLVLNGSSITGTTLGQLKACGKLRSIAVSSTAVDAQALERLAGLPAVKEVFAWNTKATAAQVQALQKKYPNITWIGGYQPDPNESLQLTPPMAADLNVGVLKVGQTFGMRHPMSGVTIRYTMDGSDPDSASSTAYVKPIPIPGVTTLKAIAVREGWRKSAVATFMLFTAGATPDSAILLSLPEEKYLAAKEASLVDGLKGDPSNLAINWLGFRERPMDAILYMGKQGPVKELTLSSLFNSGAYLFPPENIEVLGGPDRQHLSLIGKVIPTQPQKNEDARVVAYAIPLRPGSYPVIEIKVKPVAKLPAWHGGKGQKGWFFVDEAFVR